jgi:mono/diheme cytochrome c family protein
MPTPLLRPLSRRLASVALTAATLTISLGGCAGGQLGASDEALSEARSDFTQGADLFSAKCAGCHGARGEGSERGPAVIGLGALPVYPSDHDRATNSAFSDPQTLEEEARARPAGAPSRPPFRTASDVYGYISAEMPLPKDAVGSLAEQEYWAILSFMLAAHGVELPDNGVNANNAASIKVKP